MGAGDLGHLPDKARARRNAETAAALRLRVGGIVRHRVPQIDREYLKGLLSDLFSDYDDYGDVALTDIKPLIARVCDRLGPDYSPDLWPETAQGIRIGEDLLDPNERDEALDARIMAEMDRIHEWHKANGRTFPDKYWEGFGERDPP